MQSLVVLYLKIVCSLSGPVHTHPFSFEKQFFSPFSKKFVSTSSVFESFPLVHTKTLIPLTENAHLPENEPARHQVAPFSFYFLFSRVV